MVLRQCCTESEREAAREAAIDAWYEEQIAMPDYDRPEHVGSCYDPVLESLRQLREAGCLS